MKKFMGFILVLICIFVGLLAVNNETDFFVNIGTYIPALEEKYPDVADKISDISNDIMALTHQIPSISEIKAIILKEEMPIDPTDIAVNAYIKDSPMLSFYPAENIAMTVSGNELEIFGMVNSYERSNLVVHLTAPDGTLIAENAIPANSDLSFNKTIKIPETDEKTLHVSVYTGSRPYGSFLSWAYKYVTLDKDYYGDWQIEKSPVLLNNKEMYEKSKSIRDAKESTLSIQSEYANMKSLASTLTSTCDNDYDKVLKIHDWICSYLYYDEDSLLTSDLVPYHATEVVNSRRAVCLGYATLFATLCRAIDIPCNVVSGYALGISGGEDKWTEATINTTEHNHAWNEAYVDGRWIIIDTTWDSNNKYKNGEFIEDGQISHLYFDANLDFFSANHKILSYTTRR